MRLKNVVALRYGGLPSESCLGELGPELTVVLGPNESGKSTYTSLVRHVLFGFPDRRSSERLYLPGNGDKRAGRLVFADEDSEWSVTRSEGAHGGTVEDAEGWLPRLTTGVTAEMYRGILGFGLDELADARSLEELQQRLYATAAGLRVDPQEVREALRQRADAVWSPQARTRLVHQLNGKLRGVRDGIREAERAADEFRAERAALQELTFEADTLAERARASRLRAGKLSALANRATDLERRLREDTEQAGKLTGELEETEREAARLVVDEQLLSRGDALEELAERSRWVQEAVVRAEKAVERGRVARAAVDEALAALGPGWDDSRVAGVPSELGVEAGIDEAEERLREAERRLDEAARFADDARAEAGRLHDELRAVAARAGLPETDAESVARVRLHAVDVALKHTPGGGRWLVPAVVSAITALVMGIAGAALGNWPLVVAAVVPLALAGYLAFASSRAAAPAEMAAAGDIPADPQLRLDLRNDLVRFLDLSEAAWDADGKRAVLEGKAEEAAQDAEKTLASWDEWLERRKLTGVGGPNAARAALREVRRAQQALREVSQASAEESEALASCGAYVREARAAGVAAKAGEDPLGTVAAVRAARDTLQATRGDRAKHEALDAKRRGLLAELERLQERTRRASEELSDALAEAGMAAGSGTADLEALAGVASQDAERDEEEAREAIQRRSTLEGRLDAVAGDDEAARLRLEEAGLVEGLRQALEEWALAAMAGALMDETLAEYERDRQPEIVRRAREVFEYMTGGRYPKLSTPLGSFAITVQDRDSRSKDANVLSRGTAEQLYLALRLAYVDSLRDVHPALPVLMDDVLVNFDDEGRQAAAAKAVAAFSRKRQVVFFTCHARVAELFAKAAPEHTLLTLERF